MDGVVKGWFPKFAGESPCGKMVLMGCGSVQSATSIIDLEA